MSITDELREWAEGDTLRAGMSLRTARDQVLAIADRIDEEHDSEISRAAQLLADAEKDRDFNYANWQDCKQKVLQHNVTMDELNAEIEGVKDKLEHCIELPKDADGEIIHAGDKMEGLSGFALGRVVAIGVGERDGWVWVLMDGKNISVGNLARHLRHYQKPTVEDILQELATKVWNRGRLGMPVAESNVRKLVSEYAAKLRLAGEDG